MISNIIGMQKKAALALAAVLLTAVQLAAVERILDSSKHNPSSDFQSFAYHQVSSNSFFGAKDSGAHDSSLTIVKHSLAADGKKTFKMYPFAPEKIKLMQFDQEEKRFVEKEIVNPLYNKPIEIIEIIEDFNPMVKDLLMVKAKGDSAFYLVMVGPYYGDQVLGSVQIGPFSKIINKKNKLAEVHALVGGGNFSFAALTDKGLAWKSGSNPSIGLFRSQYGGIDQINAPKFPSLTQHAKRFEAASKDPKKRESMQKQEILDALTPGEALALDCSAAGPIVLHGDAAAKIIASNPKLHWSASTKTLYLALGEVVSEGLGEQDLVAGILKAEINDTCLKISSAFLPGTTSFPAELVGVGGKPASVSSITTMNLSQGIQYLLAATGKEVGRVTACPIVREAEFSGCLAFGKFQKNPSAEIEASKAQEPIVERSAPIEISPVDESGSAESINIDLQVAAADIDAAIENIALEDLAEAQEAVVESKSSEGTGRDIESSGVDETTTISEEKTPQSLAVIESLIAAESAAEEEGLIDESLRVATESAAAAEVEAAESIATNKVIVEPMMQVGCGDLGSKITQLRVLGTAVYASTEHGIFVSRALLNALSSAIVGWTPWKRALSIDQAIINFGVDHRFGRISYLTKEPTPFAYSSSWSDEARKSGNKSIAEKIQEKIRSEDAPVVSAIIPFGDDKAIALGYSRAMIFKTAQTGGLSGLDKSDVKQMSLPVKNIDDTNSIMIEGLEEIAPLSCAAVFGKNTLLIGGYYGVRQVVLPPEEMFFQERALQATILGEGLDQANDVVALVPYGQASLCCIVCRNHLITYAIALEQVINAKIELPDCYAQCALSIGIKAEGKVENKVFLGTNKGVRVLQEDGSVTGFLPLGINIEGNGFFKGNSIADIFFEEGQGFASKSQQGNLYFLINDRKEHSGMLYRSLIDTDEHSILIPVKALSGDRSSILIAPGYFVDVKASSRYNKVIVRSGNIDATEFLGIKKEDTRFVGRPVVDQVGRVWLPGWWGLKVHG